MEYYNFYKPKRYAEIPDKYEVKRDYYNIGTSYIENDFYKLTFITKPNNSPLYSIKIYSKKRDKETSVDYDMSKSDWVENFNLVLKYTKFE